MGIYTLDTLRYLGMTGHNGQNLTKSMLLLLPVRLPVSFIRFPFPLERWALMHPHLVRKYSYMLIFFTASPLSSGTAPGGKRGSRSINSVRCGPPYVGVYRVHTSSPGGQLHPPSTARAIVLAFTGKLVPKTRSAVTFLRITSNRGDAYLFFTMDDLSSARPSTVTITHLGLVWVRS